MITAFTVTRKMLNLLNQEVEVDYSFSVKDEEKKKTEIFKDIYSANAYLETSMRIWFLQSLEDFINHKKHIIHAAHQEQNDALSICLQAYDKYDKSALATIVPLFLTGFKWFVKILPSDKNPSYQSSLHNLMELKKFCEAYQKSYAVK